MGHLPTDAILSHQLVEMGPVQLQQPSGLARAVPRLFQRLYEKLAAERLYCRNVAFLNRQAS